MTSSDTIDILCATWNGAPHLVEFVESLQRQTHAAWRLWVRDDGSTDDTRAILTELGAADARIQLLPADGERLGAAGSFARLWERAAPAARYLAFADQDDLWLPHKLARSLARLQQEEARTAPDTPLLLHTDLVVVDGALHPVAPSFRAYAGLGALEAPVAERAAHNVVTGCTVLANAALRARSAPIPPDIMHDAWVACVAAACGRTVYLDEATVWYRQHGANTIGARRPPRLWSVGVWRAFFPWRERQALVRRQVAAVAHTAGALLQRLGPVLAPPDRHRLQRMATIPQLSWVPRKVAIWRHMRVPSRGWLHHLGLVVRG
jgi:hypothetical protein